MLPEGYYFTGPNMGNRLLQAYPGEMYTVGSLAYRGYINYGAVQYIDIVKAESIEAILYQARKKYFFIDFSQQVKVDGNSWILQPITQFYIHRASPYDCRYIPEDQYDGILFIDTVSEPEYVY